MKLLMENWRKFLVENTTTEEGFGSKLASAALGLGLMTGAGAHASTDLEKGTQDSETTQQIQQDHASSILKRIGRALAPSAPNLHLGNDDKITFTINVKSEERRANTYSLNIDASPGTEQIAAHLEKNLKKQLGPMIAYEKYGLVDGAKVVISVIGGQGGNQIGIDIK